MSAGVRTRVASAAVAAGVALVTALAGCGADGAADDRPVVVTTQADGSTVTRPADALDQLGAASGGAGPEVPAGEERPLRAGEERLSLTLPTDYVPSAPTGVGTDDYRCFLLDPDLAEDAFLTGTHVVPGDSRIVHHVILFEVPPDQVAAAERRDELTAGPGWTCFGGPGIGDGPGLDDAPWLGAWAPGGDESVMRKGYGVRLAKGTQIVMQVHYNLLAGEDLDTSGAALLRVADQKQDLTPVGTMLLPAPVELPCRDGRDDQPLCDRDAALEDVKERFGSGPGSTADLLHLLCASDVEPGPVQSCDRTIGKPTTILGVAGHMHLLGRSLTIEVNPGTPEARTLLDIPVWNFDDQGSKPLAKPVELQPFDTVRVTCRHTQRLRDLLPSFRGQEERYVLWGEGTTDEMCLGILRVVAS